ncbi:unnamed protein product [Adineta ricciae]|uniref:Uncharacterized protein n=1 Tax=Adineta ricciae TaxID=249248 RepID=A0A816EX55_ADIRI|nr:unnamed protein product [Adineta ricciae]CAF1651709.1 unnamed protein product [Adineta ricciae]
MSNIVNSTLSDSLNSAGIIRVPQSVRFWYFICWDILSLSCTLFNLYFLLFNRTFRRALHNHIFIVLLLICLIDETCTVPWFIRNDATLTPWQAPYEFYLFWAFFEYFLYSLQIGLFSWGTIERHILIFYDRWLNTNKKRFFFHYFPILFLIIYSLIYHIIVYFILPCDGTFDAFLNGGLYAPCAFTRTSLGTWDLIAHQLIPTLTILISSLILILRVQWQKARTHRIIDWKKQRKMVIQLVSISIIYLLFNIPWVGIILAYQFGLPASIAVYGMVYAKFLWYNITFFFPFVTCLSLPELREKIKQKLLFCQQEQRRVHVIQSTIIRRKVPQTIEQVNVSPIQT